MSMRKNWFAMAAIASAALITGCGDGTPTQTDGEKQYKIHCLSCHATGATGGIGPNITFSTTAGIGSWTQAELVTLVRTGIDKAGMKTCDTMTRFSATQLPDDKIALIYAYLKTLKNDTVNKGASCP